LASGKREGGALEFVGWVGWKMRVFDFGRVFVCLRREVSWGSVYYKICSLEIGAFSWTQTSLSYLVCKAAVSNLDIVAMFCSLGFNESVYPPLMHLA
jgi:hypothetical protein